MEAILCLVWLKTSHWKLICWSFVCLWAVTGTTQLIELEV